MIFISLTYPLFLISCMTFSRSGQNELNKNHYQMAQNIQQSQAISEDLLVKNKEESALVSSILSGTIDETKRQSIEQLSLLIKDNEQIITKQQEALDRVNNIAMNTIVKKKTFSFITLLVFLLGVFIGYCIKLLLSKI
jgi:hypothetical protein